MTQQELISFILKSHHPLHWCEVTCNCAGCINRGDGLNKLHPEVSREDWQKAVRIIIEG